MKQLGLWVINLSINVDGREMMKQKMIKKRQQEMMEQISKCEWMSACSLDAQGKPMSQDMWQVVNKLHNAY